MNCSWSELKTILDSRNITCQWVIVGNNYWIKAIDGQFTMECLIPNDSLNSDTLEFETSYKSKGNKPILQLVQPFSSKILPNGKSLFKRFTGTSFSLTSGANVLLWTQSAYALVKFLGIEVINGEVGDTCNVFILDTATGTYSGVPNYTLNQFAFNANIASEFYKHVSEYDSDMFQGLQIKIEYTSVSNKTIYINFNMNEVK
jgi:hypothetical protein